MKKLLLTWTAGKKPFKLARRDLNLISTRLLTVKNFISTDFNRKCRSLTDLKHWKATEFRMFVLYVGPVVLWKILDKDRYQHFLLLHAAIYILVSEAATDKSSRDFTEKHL